MRQWSRTVRQGGWPRVERHAQSQLRRGARAARTV